MSIKTTIRALAITSAVAAVTVTACGNDGIDQPADGNAVTTTASVSGSDRATATEAETAGETEPARLVIEGFEFTGVTEVKVGTTVTVTNVDGAPHTWTADDGTFDSGTLEAGDIYEFTFTEPGEFSYMCRFHPSMVGTIVVTT